MRYWRFDPAPCGFPSPKVPVLASPSLADFGRHRHPDFETVGLGTEHRYFRYGRYALFQAYQLCGMAPGTVLLAPSYHCRTMLDPAIRLGADVHFYRLNDDLSPNLEDIARCLQNSVRPVKALLLTHYFGVPQPHLAVSQLGELCRSQGVDLVEDCSHAMFAHKAASSGPGTRQTGQSGRFGVASPYKFFACGEGGLLWSNDGTRLGTGARAGAGWRRNAIALKNLAGSLMKPVGLAPPATTAQDLARAGNPYRPEGPDVDVDDPAPSFYYDQQDETQSCVVASRCLIQQSDQLQLVTRRRHHFGQWLDAVQGLPHCKPLVTHLPVDAVPYMFPLLIEDTSLHFPLLKHLGIPVWRWDDMAESECTVAARYRLRLLHLPCHQLLSPEQMQWMTETLSQVMNFRKTAPSA